MSLRLKGVRHIVTSVRSDAHILRLQLAPCKDLPLSLSLVISPVSAFVNDGSQDHGG